MATQVSLNSGAVASAGALAIQTNGTTQAVSISTGQVATLAQNPILTSGTANGVAYLNGSKAVTSGSALVFDGTNLGLGVTPSAWSQGKAIEALEKGYGFWNGGSSAYVVANAYFNSGFKYGGTGQASHYYQYQGAHVWSTAASGTAGNAITFTQAMTLDASGNLLVGKTTSSLGTVGHEFFAVGAVYHTRNADPVLLINRLTNDGNLVEFYQAGTLEGAISVSGTTVTYGGGHLARFGQLPDGSEDPTLLKGTVLTNLNEMCVWINKETGIPADNEQCNKVKISDVDGDANVAGVFVSWAYDEQHDTNDLYVAMTGDMIIRIAQGTTVARGDLLMSAGDGTAKPQGDDIVRSKTVAKVTSTHVTCTYADGSYCVPCVLMAC